MARGIKAASETLTVRVELFGMARIMCGRRRVEVALPAFATPGNVCRALANTCPELVGPVIRQDGTRLLDSYTFNLNGGAFVNDDGMSLKPGDALLLFSSQAGG